MGSYLSVPSYSRNTVTLEPIVKKADTEVVQEESLSAPAELQSVTKVTETPSPITSDHIEVYIKGEKKEPKVEPKIEPKEEPKIEPKVEPKVESKEEPKVEPKIEPKKEFLEIAESSKKVDLLIVKNEVVEESVKPATATKGDASKYTKCYNRIEIVEEDGDLPDKTSEDNPILLSGEELTQRILATTEKSAEQEKVRTIHKNTCDELLHKVTRYENSKPVDSDDEDVAPLSREELRKHVLREIEHNSKRVNINITEKSVQTYLKEISKEKIKTPPLEPVKEETLHDVHPFLLEYGVNPIKTNTIMIDNRMYHKNNAQVAQVAPVKPVEEVTPVAPIAPAAPCISTAPVVPAAPTNAQHNKKNKRKKH